MVSITATFSSRDARELHRTTRSRAVPNPPAPRTSRAFRHPPGFAFRD